MKKTTVEKSRQDITDLRPVFREEIRKMVISLLSPEALQPKIVNGKPATCKRMIQYFKVSMNPGIIPLVGQYNIK